MSTSDPLSNWWPRRWAEYCRSLGLYPATESEWKRALRLPGDTWIDKGRLTARLSISDRRAIDCTLRLKPYTEREWSRALDALAADPAAAQRILAGTLGPEVEIALAAVKLPLLPPMARAGVACECKQGPPCRHLYALMIQAGGHFDANPLLLFKLLGMERADLLAALRDRLAARSRRAPGTAEAPSDQPDDTAIRPDRFWEGDGDPALIPLRLGVPTVPDHLLRSLGPLPVPERFALRPGGEPIPIEEVLRRMVVQVGRGATALALGETEPVYGTGGPPGEKVPLARRLAREIEAALEAEGTMLQLDELAERCPTARAAGGIEQVRRPLIEALDLLPPNYTAIAGRYVGPAAALLRGAVLHHPISFSEWQAHELADDGDWARALAAAGYNRTSFARVLQGLRPTVGDTLAIHFTEGERLGIEVSLIPRGGRDLAALARSDAAASRLLQSLIGQTGGHPLPEAVAVGALLAEGAYRDGLHPDPIWLLPLLGPGLYLDPADRTVSRMPNNWRPGRVRLAYSRWSERERALMAYQKRLMDRGWGRRAIEVATATVHLWCDVWSGPQDQPEAAQSLGAFLHFLWIRLPHEADRRQIPATEAPSFLADWFQGLSAERFQQHLLALTLTDQYADRLRSLPDADAGEGALLRWQAEAYRWMGPALYIQNGSYW